MKSTFKIQLAVISILFLFNSFSSNGQSNKEQDKLTKPIENKLEFNGYTNHWQNNYTVWNRYGSLFKTAITDLPPTILQSKIDAADDMGIPGLFMQEGFISALLQNPCKVFDQPSKEELSKESTDANVLAIINSETPLGAELETEAKAIFGWTDALNSYQFGATDFEPVYAFVSKAGDKDLFVVVTADHTKAEQLVQLIADTQEILTQFSLKKGWFGASTLLKSVTCTPGHPLELIGRGMNEGNSWFIFDGYMDFLAQQEIKTWVQQVDLPVLADVGFSPIYGCKDYDGLQVQDMQTKQAWIDYAHQKGGYAFRPVYDPSCDAFEFDGYIAVEGNKEQIDNENMPFINKTGMLNGNMTSSMVLFVEKEKEFTQAALWDAILSRKAVAVFENALMMGPSKFRNALQLLYLDRYFLESYFSDNIDMEASVNGYNLQVMLRNYTNSPLNGSLSFTFPSGIETAGNVNASVSLEPGESRQFNVPLTISKQAMGLTNPVAVHFKHGNETKNTVAMLDLPPAISAHQLLYGHEPEVQFPVTVHNFSEKEEFPVTVEVFKENSPDKAVFEQTINCQTGISTFKELNFNLHLDAGQYEVKVRALGTEFKGQLGVGAKTGNSYAYEMDLNSDGINEYRMENDSVEVTLLRTGARVIEYIVKSKKDNVLFKIWPEKTYNDKKPFRKYGYYPYGGFEDFLGQASMETHKIYNARLVKAEGDFVRVEMEADYFGNHLKKTFTLYGNSPLLEVRYALTFKNPEANVIGPQPILELGEKHWTEDVFTVPTTNGLKEYRMRPEQYYGQAIQVQEGWNAGYDTQAKVSFVGAFPVSQPLFLHMWMNHPDNQEAPHYYVEFQPWTPIIQKTTMYFSYYLWGSGSYWEQGVNELRARNLISTRQ
ncbi:hypothetical protein INQ51_18860 [Maribellus sp. CM-23]|uniref:hypothetical protein n=1 Tax=Maribellus sp. CM-23 TaxID=2781026 RepID=UPI001F457117|nr:hypothetical protein [Maribellus sp. CM-23]MCE4566388.1 hypothetical protein [Maribellus sp. CM-23]